MFMMFDIMKCMLVTNSRKTLIGIAEKEWFQRREPISGLFCGYKFIAQVPNYCAQIQSIEEFYSIIDNIKMDITEKQALIANHEAEKKTYRDQIKHLKSLKVINSIKDSKFFINAYKQSQCVLENGYERDVTHKDLIVVHNTVLIPKRSESFFFNTEEDLLDFNIRDIVEITYPKGNTIAYVVNNILPYNWRRPTRRLALTPVTDKWANKDIVILDDSDRFRCLMEDLYPVNRRPFYGWEKKTVFIKKTGVIDILPVCKHTCTLENLYDIKDDTDVLIYSWGFNEILGVGKGQHTYCEKICTKKDVTKAVEYISKKVDEIDKKIFGISENIKFSTEMIEATTKFDYKRVFN